MNILIKDTNDKYVLVNWDNVKYARENDGYWNDPFLEIAFVGGRAILTRETLENLQDELNKSSGYKF